VNRSEDAPEGTAQYFNSNANNAQQSFGLPLGRYLDPCEVFEFYTLAITVGPKVAGKSTRVLQLRPRDTLRLGYSLALEEKSGVILRSDTISEKGELLERHEFATVTIASLSKEPSSEQAAPTRPRFVKVAGLPNGYRARLARGFEERALFVSDGIAAATVIFEPLPSTTKPGEGAVRRGATLTYTRGSVVSGKNILVTVIGEVPLAAARVIADAVKLTAGQQ
jgi:sigma-E factor negative regulatory protein RseB